MEIGWNIGLAMLFAAASACSAPTSTVPTVPDGATSDGALGDGSLPQCSARTGVVNAFPPLGMGYTYAALPFGSCSGVANCTLPVFGPCFDNSDYVGYPLNQYECSCEDDKWSCEILVQGGGVCGNNVDAGMVDGGADGAPEQ